MRAEASFCDICWSEGVRRLAVCWYEPTEGDAKNGAFDACATHKKEIKSFGDKFLIYDFDYPGDI